MDAREQIESAYRKHTGVRAESALHTEIYHKPYKDWLEERRQYIREHEQNAWDWGFRYGAAGWNVWLANKLAVSRALPYPSSKQFVGIAATTFGAGLINTGVDMLLFRSDHITNAERSFTILSDFVAQPITLCFIPGRWLVKGAAVVGMHAAGKTLDHLFLR